MIVLGIALIIAAVLLLVISSVISSALSSASPGCGASPCHGPDPGIWFAWIGIPFLLLGVALAGIGIWWGHR